jgi:hypothetical protein
MNSGDAKKIISVRVNQSDLDKVRLISQRLRVRESKVLRFAIRSMLARLGPLHDPHATGVDLMPVIAELGPEMTHYFQFDFSRLETIINGNGCTADKQVDSQDIALVAVNDMPAAYRYKKLCEVSDRPVDKAALDDSLRDYLLGKYVDGSSDATPAESD